MKKQHWHTQLFLLLTFFFLAFIWACSSDTSLSSNTESDPNLEDILNDVTAVLGNGNGAPSGAHYNLKLAQFEKCPGAQRPLEPVVRQHLGKNRRVKQSDSPLRSVSAEYGALSPVQSIGALLVTKNSPLVISHPRESVAYAN